MESKRYLDRQLDKILVDKIIIALTKQSDNKVFEKPCVRCEKKSETACNNCAWSQD